MRTGAEVSVLVLLATCSLVMTAANSDPNSDPGPDADPVLSVALAGFDDEHHNQRGVVVMRNGKLIAERHFNGATADSQNDIRSAGKSITSLLLGIALDQGKIRSVDDPVTRYWSQAQGSAVGDVPLRDVLTMRTAPDSEHRQSSTPAARPANPFTLPACAGSQWRAYQ